MVMEEYQKSCHQKVRHKTDTHHSHFDPYTPTLPLQHNIPFRISTTVIWATIINIDDETENHSFKSPFLHILSLFLTRFEWRRGGRRLRQHRDV